MFSIGYNSEKTESSPKAGVGVRHCNWLRFLRLSLLMDDTVNIVGTKVSSGEPIFEVTSLKLLICHHISWILVDIMEILLRL